MSINLVPNMCLYGYSRPSKSRGAYGRPKTRNPFPSSSFVSNGNPSHLLLSGASPDMHVNGRRMQRNNFNGMLVIGSNKGANPRPRKPSAAEVKCATNEGAAYNQKPRLKHAQHQRFLSISHCVEGQSQAKVNVRTKDRSFQQRPQRDDVESSYKLTFYHPQLQPPPEKDSEPSTKETEYPSAPGREPGLQQNWPEFPDADADEANRGRLLMDFRGESKRNTFDRLVQRMFDGRVKPKTSAP